jgi:hypothetical protein
LWQYEEFRTGMPASLCVALAADVIVSSLAVESAYSFFWRNLCLNGLEVNGAPGSDRVIF